MHRLEITGATPEDLFMNAIRMLSVLLKGGAQPAAPETPFTPQTEYVAGDKVQTPEGASEVVPAKKTRGTRASKTATTGLNDDISDVGKTIEHDPKEKDGKPPAELTLDGDIRPRLRAIQKACTERGLDMPACVAYIQKLYGPFGITKADQLKPDQFAEFLEASEGYLSGEA